MPDTEKPRTWNDVRRSTEEEHQEFRKKLNSYLITPENLNDFLKKLREENRSRP